MTHGACPCTLAELEAKAKQIRRDILEMGLRASGYPAHRLGAARRVPRLSGVWRGISSRPAGRDLWGH